MDPGCGLQGSFDARLVARPRVRAGHLVGNSRVYGIIDNENMYYIPTRLEMHRMGSVWVLRWSGSADAARDHARDQAAGCRVARL